VYSRPSVYFKLNITTLYNHTLKYNKAMSPVLITHQNLGWTPSSKVNKICLPHCALTTINRKQFKLIYYWLNSTYIGILFTRRRKTCCTNTHRHLFHIYETSACVNTPCNRQYRIFYFKSSHFLALDKDKMFIDEDISVFRFAGVSKWAGTRYFYPPEIVYSTGRNYWTPQN
jgi:hypothetical protein